MAAQDFYGSVSSPWYNQYSPYGQSQNWKDTPFVRKFVAPTVPEGVFMEFSANRGFGGTDSMSEWVQGLYGKTLAGYKAATLENPALDYRTYLARNFNRGSLQNMFNAQSPRAKGYAQSPNTRVIGAG